MRLIDAEALKKDVARLHALNSETEIRRAYANNPHSTTTDFEDTLVSVFDAIDEAPTIDAVSVVWIPCEERLPSENGRYLVSYWLMKDTPWISVMYYGKPIFPEKDHPCFYVSDDEYGDVEYDDIVAWMPLPKPYGEREGE